MFAAEQRTLVRTERFLGPAGHGNTPVDTHGVHESNHVFSAL